MKRFFVLLALACILATLLVVPVLAAEHDIVFEMMPSVSLLPSFSAPEDGSVAMTCEGVLPEGRYSGYIYLSVYSSFLAFDDFIYVDFSSGEEFEGYPVSVTDTSFELQNQYVPVQLSFLYFEEEDMTVVRILFNDGETVAFSDRDVLILVPAESSEGDSGTVLLKGFIADLFGPYEQQTETITQTLADGSTVTVEQRIPGIAGLDYEWFASVALFALVLLSFFRLLGGMIKQ